MNPEAFKGLRLVISTPMYRSEVCDAYMDSRCDLERYLRAAGITFYAGKVRDTYLPRARNILAAQLMDTDATHHLLLDSDMGFDAVDVMRMLYHVATRPEIEILGAAYPQREIDWQRIKDAVLANPKITSGQMAAVAPKRWTFSGLPDGKYDMASPVELTGKNPHIGTGLMIVKRIVYESMKRGRINYTDWQSKKPMSRYFHCDVDFKVGNWIGEDVMFCREWTKMGGKIWLAPWVKTEHWGPMCSVGDVSKVIDAGVDVFA